MYDNIRISSSVISYGTLVLEPVLIESRLVTRIYERNQIFNVPLKPKHYLNKSCRHYGTSYRGTSNISKKFLKNRHKLPIIVAYNNGLPIIALPMMSPESDQNVWIFLHAIINFERSKKGCLVHMEFNQTIDLDVSIATIERQIALGIMLERECTRRFQRINGSSFPEFR